jgi:transposase
MGERQRRRFNREYKLEAVRLLAERGNRVSEVARDLELRPDMLRRWQRELEEDQRQTFPGQGHLKADEEEMRRLRRELERVREERDILKKALAIFSGPSR